MRRGIYCLLFVLLIVVFSSCEEEPEDLQINDFVNQEYEAKKNRLFAATIGFEEFEASKVEVDSFNGQWIFWAFNESKQVKILLPYIKIQSYFATDSNEIEMRYKQQGGEWYSSIRAKKSPHLNIEITQVDSTIRHLFGRFEGEIFNEKSEKLFVKRGVFNRVKY